MEWVGEPKKRVKKKAGVALQASTGAGNAGALQTRLGIGPAPKGRGKASRQAGMQAGWLADR